MNQTQLHMVSLGVHLTQTTLDSLGLHLTQTTLDSLGVHLIQCWIHLVCILSDDVGLTWCASYTDYLTDYHHCLLWLVLFLLLLYTFW